MVYVGVDLHRKRSQVAVVNEAGEVLANRAVATEGMEVMRVFGEVAPKPTPISVAFEATFGWGWFADLLQDAGVEVHMSHPLATKAIASARVKNDAVDARTLAQLLRTGMLPDAWIAPPGVREARRLVRMRVSLVRIRSQIKSQVHALLAEHGVGNPVSDLFGKRGRQILEQLRLPELSRNRVEACLRLVDDLDKEIEIADTEILEWRWPVACSAWSTTPFATRAAAGPSRFRTSPVRPAVGRARCESWPPEGRPPV